MTSVDVESINDLAPGRDAAIDSICRSILLDELPGQHDTRPAAVTAAGGVVGARLNEHS